MPPVVAAYETWFAREATKPSPAPGAGRAAAARLLRPPARRDLLDALRAAPPIPGLTEPFQTSPSRDQAVTGASAQPRRLRPWRTARPALERSDSSAHPLVRDPYPGRGATRRALAATRRLAGGAPADLRAAQGERPPPSRGTGRTPAALPGRGPRVPGGAVAGGLRRGLSRPHPARDGARRLLQLEEARGLRRRPGGRRLSLRRALVPPGPGPGRGRPGLAAQRGRLPPARPGPAGGGPGADAGRGGDACEAEDWKNAAIGYTET